MKLHDLRPAEGSRTERTRVGRGIAAGKGKTAGRGTKGQKARAGGSIPPWFEGGQTPLHVRIPKLRGFKNRFKVHYEVVNVGDIGAAASRGAFDSKAAPAKSGGKGASSGAQITINQDILRAVGLVRTLDKPLKILGNGEVDSPLFVVADAFTASARTKIEAAGGSVNVLEVPTKPMPAIGRESAKPADTAEAADAPAKDASPTIDDDADDDAPPAAPTRKARASKAASAEAAESESAAVAAEASADAASTDDTEPATEADADAGTDADADATSRDDATPGDDT
jgi:large subunit ribosomal protein L15